MINLSEYMPAWLILSTLFVLGAFVGRYLNICIRHFPEHDELLEQLKLTLGRQPVCRRCNADASFVQRLPIIGWMSQGGRCSNCGSRLTLEPIFVELITAVLFALTYWLHIPMEPGARMTASGLYSVDGPAGPGVAGLWEPVVWLHARYALHMFMICGLIAATMIDLRLRIIPDGTTVPVWIAGILVSVIIGQVFVVPIWFQDPSVVRTVQPLMPELIQPLFVDWDVDGFIIRWPRVHGLLVSLFGAAAGAGSVWAVRVIGGYVLKQEAMGQGDVILMGMIGSVIGWQPVLSVFIFAPVLGVAFSVFNWLVRGDKQIAYGPFLSAATIMLLLTWKTTWPFAKRFFDMGPLFIVMGLFMLVLLFASLQLVQIVKRLLGFELYDFEEESDWPPADQLMYLSQEVPDEQTGQWPIEQWSGIRAGQGLSREHSWRNDD